MRFWIRSSRFSSIFSVKHQKKKKKKKKRDENNSIIKINEIYPKSVGCMSNRPHRATIHQNLRQKQNLMKNLFTKKIRIQPSILLQSFSIVEQSFCFSHETLSAFSLSKSKIRFSFSVWSWRSPKLISVWRRLEFDQGNSSRSSGTFVVSRKSTGEVILLMSNRRIWGKKLLSSDVDAMKFRPLKYLPITGVDKSKNSARRLFASFLFCSVELHQVENFFHVTIFF